MGRTPFAIFLLTSGFILSSCKDNFNPAAPFTPRMVVYSVLSNATDTQYVRVYTTYNPANNNPLNNPDENPVTDAQVTISDGSMSLTLHDTTLDRPDKTRYPSDIFAYTLNQ